jgi:hypothetical protein
MYTLQPRFFLQSAHSIRADRTRTAATTWQLDAEQHPRLTNSEKNYMSYEIDEFAGWSKLEILIAPIPRNPRPFAFADTLPYVR